MRKIILVLAFATITAMQAICQAPESFKYQSVIRNSSGKLIAEKLVSLRISILSGTVSSTSVYSEVFTISTNNQGIVNIEIGNGTSKVGAFTTIDWGSNIYFIKTEIDENGGSSYKEMGTSQLLSVPYALYAKKANESDPLFNASLAKGIKASDTTRWGTKPIESDPIFKASVAKGIKTSDTLRWGTKPVETDPFFNTSIAKGIKTSDTLRWGKKEINDFRVSASGDSFFVSKTNYLIIPGLSAANSNGINSTGVVDIDGNIYHTVKIGTQIWMKENLNTTKYNDGTAIPNVTDGMTWINLTSGAYCNFDNNSSNSAIYGRLYNYYAVVNSRKLCPTGWHIPSNSEWTTMENYLIANSYNYDGTILDNKIALALASSTGWNTSLNPAFSGTPISPDYPSYRNKSGFTGLPAGQREVRMGIYDMFGIYGYWWTTTQISTTNAIYKSLMDIYPNTGGGDYSKSYGLSVRCLKD